MVGWTVLKILVKTSTQDTGDAGQPGRYVRLPETYCWVSGGWRVRKCVGWVLNEVFFIRCVGVLWLLIVG